MIKKPVIKKFTFTKEEQDQIDRIKRGEPVENIRIVTNKRGFQYEVKSYKSLTPETARRKLFGFYGGLCIICGTSWPNYKVTYDVGDAKQPAKRIERYCNSCIKKKELILKMINRKYNTTLRDSKVDEDDGIEVEVTEYPYFDDNLVFAGSTDNVVDSKTGSFIAVIDFNADGEGKVRICPHCEEYGFHHKLGPKILQKGEQKAPDYDEWLSCYECGNTFPRHLTFLDSKIKDSLETTDNPFEGNEPTFLSLDSRATQRRKGKKPRSRRLKIEQHEDPEIKAEINKGNTVRIIQDN